MAKLKDTDDLECFRQSLYNGLFCDCKRTKEFSETMGQLAFALKAAKVLGTLAWAPIYGLDAALKEILESQAKIKLKKLMGVPTYSNLYTATFDAVKKFVKNYSKISWKLTLGSCVDVCLD